jgi:hypothetical protein
LSRPDTIYIHRVHKLALGIVLASMVATSAHAQKRSTVSIDSLQAGERLRAAVIGPDRFGRDSRVWIAGWFVSRAGDTLRMTTPGDGRVALPQHSVVELRVARGRTHPYLSNGFLGAAIGTLVGALVSSTNPRSTSCVAGVCTPPPKPPRARNMTTGAVAGAAIGAAFAVRGTPAWFVVR